MQEESPFVGEVLTSAPFLDALTSILDNTRRIQRAVLDMANQRDKALGTIHQYGGIDGGHHKQWVLDQVVRALTGESYHQWVAMYEAGEEGPHTYSWDTGIAP